MEMSTALQVALFLASIAFIALVACLIPIAFQARRQLERLAQSAEQSKAKLEALAQDTHELIRNVTDLSKRANRQMDTVDEVVGTVRQWAERADRIVNEVGSAIEPPVFQLVKNLNLFRTGAATFLQALFQKHPNNNRTKQEKDHV